MQLEKGKSNKNQLNAVQNLFPTNATKTPQKKYIRKKRAKYECSPELIEMIRLANLAKGFQFSFDDFLTNNTGQSFALSCYEYFRALPKEILSYILTSKDVENYEKREGYEFWLNNDGYAQDKLIELDNDNEISDEVFNRLKNSDADEIAYFLVEFGFYGDEYSYANQQKEQSESLESSFSIFENTFEDKSDEYYNLAKMIAYMGALERLQGIRDFLLAIINLARNIEIVASPSEESSYKQRKKQQDFTNELITKKLKDRVLGTIINIAKDGRIEFSVSEWANILQGVDITRIRLCEICEIIFWANRIDTFACSKKHSKVRQMRLLRDNWKTKGELYLKARQKKANKKEEKQNGDI